jgi:hypothetical protein
MAYMLDGTISGKRGILESRRSNASVGEDGGIYTESDAATVQSPTRKCIDLFNRFGCVLVT